MSEYALGRPKGAVPLVEQFLALYQTDDGFRRNAKMVLERIAKGLPPATTPRH